MRLPFLLILVLAISLSPLAPSSPVVGQGPVVPSDGSDGAFAPTSDMELDLSLAATGPWTQMSTDPLNGLGGPGVYDESVWAVVFKYSSVNVPAGVTVTFKNHPSRAPVVWLVQGDVTIAGSVVLSGEHGNLPGSLEPMYAEPGPGGFRGGRVSFLANEFRSGGFGPGGPGFYGTDGAGAGHSTTVIGDEGGRAYGSPAVQPLIGGSGGSADRTVNTDDEHHRGGAGGGALLLASGTSIHVQSGGSIVARGGDGYDTRGANTNGNDDRGGSGSGGAIRLVADSVQLDGTVDVRGGRSWSSFYHGAEGYIRIEASSSVLTGATVIPLPSESSTFGPLLPDTSAPTVRVVSLAGVSVPNDPRARLEAIETDVTIPQPGPATVVVETQNVDPAATVELRITRRVGAPIRVPADGDAPIPLTGSFTSATAQIQVDLPTGVSAIQARVVLP